MATEYKPRYVMFHLEDFYASPRVRGRLDWVERHLYLMLCLQANYCKSRPYLPQQDSELALLADCPDDVWALHRENVLQMFTLHEDPDTEEVLGWSNDRILEDWKKQVAANEEYRARGRNGGLAKAKRRLTTEPKPNQTEPNSTETQQNKTLQGDDTRTEPNGTSGGSASAAAKPRAIAPSSSGDGRQSGSDRGGSGKQEKRDDAADPFDDEEEAADGLVRYWWSTVVPAANKKWSGKGGVSVGVESEGDATAVAGLIRQHGKQVVQNAMRWALVDSNYWGKDGKLAGIRGFANALPEILRQKQAFEGSRRKG